MKFGVVVFPGSNCDRDVISALRDDLNQQVVELWHKDSDLSAFSNQDCIILPGGFSYGDYLRCGAIAKFSPMMQSVIEFANAGGKVFGVCNGFQILCEAGLLQGALLRNGHQQFVCKNVFIKGNNEVLKIPVAHGEGRFYAEDVVLDELENNNQVIFRYCNEKGEVSSVNDIDLALYNPNGAVRNIAGIKNNQGNVFGMMPHPERATSVSLGNLDGLKVFELLSLN